MHRVGGLVGCSTAKIGSWKLLGLQDVAPQGQPACNNVCDCLRHSKGVGFKRAAFIQQESNVSGLTQMSYAWDGVGGRRSCNPACC